MNATLWTNITCADRWDVSMQRVVCAMRDLCIVEASPEGYRELGRKRILSGRCWSVPVLAHGKIYARNAAGRLVCVELIPAGL